MIKYINTPQPNRYRCENGDPGGPHYSSCNYPVEWVREDTRACKGSVNSPSDGHCFVCDVHRQVYGELVNLKEVLNA